MIKLNLKIYINLFYNKQIIYKLFNDIKIKNRLFPI